MSLSKECQYYHLTPNGWVQGSFYGDALGGTTEVPLPKDSVLTIGCYDEIPAAFVKPFYYDQIIWESEDKQQLEKLKNKWGEKPNWIGYDLMKK